MKTQDGGIAIAGQCLAAIAGTKSMCGIVNYGKMMLFCDFLNGIDIARVAIYMDGDDGTGFLRDWLFLCERPWKGKICKPFYSKDFGLERIKSRGGMKNCSDFL